MGIEINLQDKVYPHFEVIGKSAYKDKWGSTYWYCQCTCGELFIRKGTAISRNRIKSCGCIRRLHDKLPQGISEFNRLLRVYKRHAKLRGYDFSLTRDEFYTLTKQNCYYCNQEPSNRLKSEYSSGDYIYNGVDRINNTLGYSIDNVVSCCGICNAMKSSMDADYFIKKCKTIAENRSKV